MIESSRRRRKQLSTYSSGGNVVHSGLRSVSRVEKQLEDKQGNFPYP